MTPILPARIYTSHDLRVRWQWSWLCGFTAGAGIVEALNFVLRLWGHS
ncbi:MAG: hypothetical protein ACYDB1_00650 [Acidiferrobacteraceae bacterium]